MQGNLPATFPAQRRWRIELAVEQVQRGEVEGAGKELVAHGPKKSFDFSFRCSIAHGRVMKQAADPGADLDDFFGAVNGAVVHVEGLRHAAFVESGAERFDERINIFSDKELAVTADTTGVIEESDEAGLERRALVLNVRADEGVGLPHFIGVGFGEGQA